MLEVFIYIGLTLIISFFFGAGVSFLILPKKLQPYRLWLAPWIFFFILILTLTFFSFIGISTSVVSPYILFSLLIINVYVFIIKKEFFFIDWKYDTLVAVSVIISIIFNISPIIKKEHLLTTISLGNNDVVAYATAADYLVRHSILESFYTNVALPIEDLFHIGGRWGPPILESFFLFIFELKGYQYTYILEVMLYALMIPLAHIFFQILYRKTFFTLLFLSVLLIFNANLLYMVYHNFFGVVIFWGIALCILIGVFTYLTDDKIDSSNFNRYDLLLVIFYSVLYASYHEGMIFVTAPLFFYFIYRLIFKQDYEVYLSKLLKLLCGVFLITSISIINALVFDYKQAFGGFRGGEIGWQVFRKSIPYANPFEMIGFYSIHSFEPIPLLIASLLSLFVVGVVVYGLLKSKNKILLTLYFLIFLLFLYWYGPYSKHFFNYNRVVTYSLPFFIVLFVIGITEAISKRKKIWIISILFLCLPVVYSGLKLNRKFMQEYKAVSQPFISLQWGPFPKLTEPIYTSKHIFEAVPIWDTVWTEYFIYPLIQKNYYSSLKPIHNNSLILTGKPIEGRESTRILYKEIVWENEYFRLGKICKEKECLLKSKKDLSTIQIGNNEYEDTLFIKEWDKIENNARWVKNYEATVRLITKKSPHSFVFTALTLKEPQLMKVYINEMKIGELQLTQDWKTHSIPVNDILPSGIHLITLKFSNLYVPDDVLHNGDRRKLAAQFKLIKLE